MSNIFVPWNFNVNSIEYVGWNACCGNLVSIGNSRWPEQSDQKLKVWLKSRCTCTVRLLLDLSTCSLLYIGRGVGATEHE